MKTLFVAEVSSNHGSDLSRCLAFVEEAAKIGCDAVKFQLFRIDKLFAPEILARSARHRERRVWELPPEFLPTLAKACREHNIAFCCTPFDLEAVAELEPFVDFYKIASYELTWPALLEACAGTGKPVVLSTGMATLEECIDATALLRQAGSADLTLLHCVSSYPSKPADSNLFAIDTLRNACRCKAGWSDHSVNPGVIYQAVFGHKAAMIEFHLDLDGTGAEFASGHCWLPAAMREVIRTVRDGESATGDGVKRVTDSERKESLWRADPEDGLRPFKSVRAGFKGD